MYIIFKLSLQQSSSLEKLNVASRRSGRQKVFLNLEKGQGKEPTSDFW